MIAFLDTEVATSHPAGQSQHNHVADYGAVTDGGAEIHTQSASEFAAFLTPCATWCGHNIIKHDLKYIRQPSPSGHLIIDTLYLSPLLFPKKPYHHLVKDYKLQTEDLNNPLGDAIKTRELYLDEVAAWHRLSPAQQTIYYHLLHNQAEFSGFFTHHGINLPWADLPLLIEHEYHGKLCSHANLGALARSHPVELAYALAVISADDIVSMTPAWVIRNYPKVANVMNLLRNTPCDNCTYCLSHLNARQGLKEFFGYDTFRTFDGIPMQQQAVEAALHNQSLLTIFPTGGGKSLTFQLPALMAGRNTHGLTVVISPLQSLMKDQVDNLTERGISDAVAINGLLDPIERADAINQVASGTANILYISPEMLRSSTIQRLLTGRNIVRFVIDEAHCFSAWGHDFRVDYLYIGKYIRQLQETKHQQQPIAISCFTATAKQKVVADIVDYFQKELGLNLKIFAASAERKNLRYAVIHADTPNDKYNLLRNLILGRKCPTIVYVSRTKRTHELSQHLNADGIKALPFNGRMESEAKVRNQNAFMGGQAQVIVATSAFGMGVDKKDVGLVIHYDISDSLENYVQEAGRAGRDPKTNAECYVLYNDNDLDKHFILLNQTKLSISEIQQVWQAIKKLTPTQATINCSPLEIARQAGWNEDTLDIETRVKAAVAALEDAGYIERGNNVPHVFATGITVGNMDEARARLNRSPLFDQTTREEAARIIRSLISNRATDSETESRIDYLADMLGLTKESVVHNVNLMRQEGLLTDSHDMQAWIEKTTTARDLEQTLRLEQFIITQLLTGTAQFNYKDLNEKATQNGIPHTTVRRIKTLLYFLSIKGYIQKEEHTASGNVTVSLPAEDTLAQRFGRRADLCRFIVKELTTLPSTAANTGQAAPIAVDPNQKTLVNFSEVALLNRYLQSQQQLQLGTAHNTTLADIEEALLYLSKTALLKIEGGFLVIYNSMQLTRKTDRRTRYNKEQYRMLDEFYKMRIRQIHIVGAYANLMVRDYGAALQFVNDYFQMDFRRFISKYFKGERKTEIEANITPAKYRQIFGSLDPRQLQIINDKQSRHIVVAAGPGSGKTRVLVHKLASLLLMEDVKHEQMLMLTFSRSAATEFKKRLLELIGNAAHFFEIKTFHSYSFDLLGKPGNLDQARNAVRQAADMIESGEVEESKIVKSVLVIDEAQDMGADESRLLEALMLRNENMRVIAVGDDDQNIYAFRGSDSAHLKALVTRHGATLYEMTTNYRSAQSIVTLANRFATLLPDRMKKTPGTAHSHEPGTVELHRYDSPRFLADTTGTIARSLRGGQTACLLTSTNEEALQLAYLLQRQGIETRLLQSMDSFRFIHLAEVRYFLKHLPDDPTGVCPRREWDRAKQRTLEKYSTSSCLDIMQRFFADFEATHPVIYRSDLAEYLYESDTEDFIQSDRSTLFVSTIHKAKGREFDTVHLVVPTLRNDDPAQLRTLYVGLTRAKQQLYIHTHNTPFCTMATPIVHHASPADSMPLCIALTLRDIFLNFIKDRKREVLALRSGDPLRYADRLLYNRQGQCVAALSNKGAQKLTQLEARGYRVTDAQVSYVVAWRPKEEENEYAVCLANLHLAKIG